MFDAFERALNPVAAQNPSVLELRRTGVPLLGYTCSVFPEEIAYAAGIVPIRALGAEGCGNETGLLQPAAQCFVAKGSMELALGGGYLGLSGFVITNACDMCHNFHAALEFYKPFRFHHFISRPNVARSEGALRYFRYELDAFQAALETHFGLEITDANLSAAIATYNEHRRLLSQLADLRGAQGGPRLLASEFSKVMVSSFYMDKARHNALMKELLEHLRSGPPVVGDPVRVHLSGASLASSELFDLIESAGGLVVSDDLCTGARHFVGQVDENRDPLDALADRYLNQLACPCMHHPGKFDERYAFIRSELIRNSGDGVLFALYRYCDTHLADFQALRDRLERDGIPYLYHELDASVGAQFRTKLEAFFEILRDR